MSLTLAVQDQTSSGRVTGSIRLDGVDAQITLRDLIRTRVREEVAAHNADRLGPAGALVVPDPDAPHRSGAAHTGEPRVIDWERQAEVAVQAFLTNGFFVTVDGQRRTDLDAPLALTADSDVRFIRLVQLVGG